MSTDWERRGRFADRAFFIAAGMVGAGCVLGVPGEENTADTLGAWQAVGVLLFCTGVAIVFATFALRSNPENDTPAGFRVAMAILSMLLLAIGILAVVSNWLWA